MKRVLRATVLALMAAVLCIGLAPDANAASSAVSANLDVTINSTVVPTHGDTVTLVLKTEDGPLPEGAASGVYRLPVEIGSAVTEVNIPLTFDRVGEYHYTLSLEGSDRYTNPMLAYFAGYDTKSYGFTMTVFNEFDANGTWQRLLVTSNVELSGLAGTQGKEKPTLTFDNTYDPPAFVSVLKKWVGGKGNSVQVSLMSGGVKYDTVTLSEGANNWTHTWDGSEFGGPGYGLNAKYDWYVEEFKNLAGFVSTTRYDEARGIWVITNTRALLQTGQLNWPIPVLAASGMLLIALGCLMLRKREEQDA